MTFWLIIAMMPAKAGEETDVPATDILNVRKLLESVHPGAVGVEMQTKYGSCWAAFKETSGRTRLVKLAPDSPAMFRVCQLGAPETVLIPPPPEANEKSWEPEQKEFGTLGVQLSFQTFSGI